MWRCEIFNIKIPILMFELNGRTIYNRLIVFEIDNLKLRVNQSFIDFDFCMIIRLSNRERHIDSVLCRSESGHVGVTMWTEKIYIEKSLQLCFFIKFHFQYNIRSISYHFFGEQNQRILSIISTVRWTEGVKIARFLLNNIDGTEFD